MVQMAKGAKADKISFDFDDFAKLICPSTSLRASFAQPLIASIDKKFVSKYKQLQQKKKILYLNSQRKLEGNLILKRKSKLPGHKIFSLL